MSSFCEKKKTENVNLYFSIHSQRSRSEIFIFSSARPEIKREHMQSSRSANVDSLISVHC